MEISTQHSRVNNVPHVHTEIQVLHSAE